MKIIYVAGPYNGKTFSAIDDNIRKAEYAALQLWKKGWAVICPHLNTAHFERYQDENFTDDVFYGGTMEMLERCDAIFMLDAWTNSTGSKHEHGYAMRAAMPIFYQGAGYPDPDTVPRREWKTKVNKAISLIIREYGEATEKFGTFNTIHEGLAVVREEYLEFEAECMDKKAYDDQTKLAKEAVQLGAMALRFLVDCCEEK